MKTWLVGFALFAALTAAAQADIVAGTVVDRSNQPVANADVAVTLASGEPPLHATTDAAGRFTVETDGAPASVSVRRGSFFEAYSMALAAVAPSVMADLHVVLNTRLVTIVRDVSRSACAAWQPWQTWDSYNVTPNGCGRHF